MDPRTGGPVRASRETLMTAVTDVRENTFGSAPRRAARIRPVAWASALLMLPLALGCSNTQPRPPARVADLGATTGGVRPYEPQPYQPQPYQPGSQAAGGYAPEVQPSGGATSFPMPNRPTLAAGGTGHGRYSAPSGQVPPAPPPPSRLGTSPASNSWQGAAPRAYPGGTYPDTTGGTAPARPGTTRPIAPGPVAPGPGGYRPDAYPRSNTAPAQPRYTNEAFRWYTTLNEAQAAARRQGKLILALATKDNCPLCDRFKNDVLPNVRSETGQVAVGYVYNIARPDEIVVDRVLRAKLKPRLMPLVGFLTPEMQWVDGFYGRTSDADYRRLVQRVSSRMPRRIAAAVPERSAARPQAPTPTGRYVAPSRGGDTYASDNRRIASTIPQGMVAIVNEYGETEYVHPGDLQPRRAPRRPADEPDTNSPTAPGPAGVDPRAVVADQPAAPAAPAGPDPAAAVAAGLPDPDSALDPATALADGLADPDDVLGMPADTPTAAAPRSTDPFGAAAEATEPMRPPTRTPSTFPNTPPSTTTVPTPPARPAVESAARPTGGDAGWARTRLDRALALIQSGRYAEARGLLTEVEQRLPESDWARTARRGRIAIHNARRIADASSTSEREAVRQRAQRDLGTSHWAPLFS